MSELIYFCLTLCAGLIVGILLTITYIGNCLKAAGHKLEVDINLLNRTYHAKVTKDDEGAAKGEGAEDE